MITVEDVQKKIEKSGQQQNAVNEEQILTGTIKAVKQPLWPWIVALIGLGIFGYWFWKKGKQNNGDIPG
jgi:hypothetical protein